MVRFVRRSLRVFGRVALGAGVGVAALALPPKESLPTESLLYARVVLEGIGRVLRCAQTGAVVFVDYKYSTYGCDDDQAAWDAVHYRTAHRLVHLAEQNGGLYVKTGQVFASMSHLLPRPYTETMRVLQDAVVKRPFSEIVAVLQQDLGKSIDEVFESLNPIPIAAASLAQVHRGVLRHVVDGGQRDVAVKVQYIDIAQRFRGDIGTIRLMLGICGSLFPGYDFSSIITKLDQTIAQELDFVAEGRNSDRAGAELKAVFGDAVSTPYIHWEYASPRVLITDFIEGVRISDRSGLVQRGIDVARVATLCYSALAFQMFISGFVHADPHAGNILVHKPACDGRKWSKGRTQVVLLDHGLYTYLDAVKRHRLACLWTSAVTHRSRELETIAVEMGVTDYKMLGSMFLQHPYEYFSSFKRSMTPEELSMMHNHAKEKMEEINNIVDAMPCEYALVLRSLSALRAINKDLGNPVRRPLVLLRYSLRESHGGSFLGYYWAFLKAWWEEWSNDVTTYALTLYSPELMKEVEDALAMA